MLPYTPNSSSYIHFFNIIINPLWCFNVGRLLVCCFIYFVLPENAMKHFVAVYLALRVYCSYFDQTITEILSIFTNITYLWHTREATAVSDKTVNNTCKNWGWHILVMEYFTVGQFSRGRVIFTLFKKDPGSIFFISLQKLINQQNILRATNTHIIWG